MSSRLLGRGRKIARLALSALLAICIVWPVQATRAFAAQDTGVPASGQVPSLSAPQADGVAGSVTICATTGTAGAIARAIGLDEEAAIQEGAVLSQGGFSWRAVMEISGESAAAGNDALTAAQIQETYLLVGLSADACSAETLIAWLEGVSGVSSVEAEVTGMVDGDAEATLEQSEYPLTNYFSSAQSLTAYDEYYWFLHNDGSLGDGLAGHDINLAGASASSDTVVALIDTGVATNHPALQGHLATLSDYPDLMAETGAGVNGYNSDSTTDKSNVYDDNGHGTHTAGLVVLASSNGGQEAGAQVLPIKACRSDGGFTTVAIAEGLSFVVKAKQAGMNIVAVNLSLGMEEYHPAFLQAAYHAVIEAGVAVVTAAGNAFVSVDNNPYSTSSLSIPGVLTVGATSPTGYKAGFSNYGRNNVDILAPGGQILSTTSSGGLTHYSSILAYANTINDTPDSSKSVYYEGFENSGSTDEQSIGGGLQFTYATVDDGRYYGDLTVYPSTTPVEVVSDCSNLGSNSALFGYSDETRAVVSRVLNTDDVADPSQLQAYNFYVTTALEQGEVLCGLIDETGKFVTAVMEGKGRRQVLPNLWATLGNQNDEAFPESVRKDIMSENPEHSYRMVILVQRGKHNPYRSEYGNYYLDSVSIGYGMEGYVVFNGTSMASPIAAAAVAIAATKWPDASPQELVARVKGGVSVNEEYAEYCSSSGSLDVAGMSDPAPVVQTATVEGGVVTLAGYFFGSAQGGVTIGGEAASVLTWKSAGNASTVQVALPDAAADGINTIVVTSAQGKQGRSRMNLGIVSGMKSYSELASPYEVAAEGLGEYMLGSCSHGSVLLNYQISSHLQRADATLGGKLDVLEYDPAANTWTRPLHNVAWADALGMAGASSAAANACFELDGELYFALTVSFNKGASFICSVCRYDFESHALVRIVDLDRLYDDYFVADGVLYGISYLNIGSADIPAGWPDGSYLMAFQLSLESGSSTLVGGMNYDDIDAAVNALDPGASLGNMFASSYAYADGYLTVMSHYANCSCVVGGDVFGSGLDHPAVPQVVRLPFSLADVPSENIPVMKGVNEFLVVVGAPMEGRSETLVIDTSDGSIEVSAEKLSLGIASMLKVGLTGNMLYVLGSEDSSINPGIMFFRSLDLTAYITDTPDPGPTPTPTPTPEPAPAPADDNKGTKAISATGDNAPLAAAVLSLFASALLGCYAAAKRRRQ